MSRNRLFLSSLAVSAFAVAISNGLMALLLLEISSTFQVNEGVAAQLRTVNAAAEVVFGLLMGFLAMRFRPKTLLLLGMFLVAVSAIGSFFSPNLSSMLFFSFIEGSGSIMVTIISLTLIGSYLPLSRKAKAISLIIAAGFLVSFVGNPLINLFASMGSWRYVFSLLVLPVSVLGLFLDILSVPSSKSEMRLPAIVTGKYLSHFKKVLLDKSATSCLIGALCFGVSSVVGVFAIAFYREQFLMSREHAVYVLITVALVLIAGSLAVGHIRNRISAKSLTVASILGTGIFSLMLFFAPNLWTALVFNFLAAFSLALASSAYPCLVLEQGSPSLGLMVSLYRMFYGIVCIIGPALAGGLLVLFSSNPIETGYHAVGTGLGVIIISAAGILYFFTENQKLA
jgi:predicted MFS family arabinose efflux permease